MYFESVARPTYTAGIHPSLPQSQLYVNMNMESVCADALHILLKDIQRVLSEVKVNEMGKIICITIYF